MPEHSTTSQRQCPRAARGPTDPAEGIALGKLLHHVGRLAATRKWFFLGGWLIVAVTVVLLVRVVGAETNDKLQLPGTDSQAATDLLASRFPPQQNGASPIVFHTSNGKVTDAANKSAIEASHAALVQLPHVYSATDPFSQQGQAQVSKDGKTAFIPVLLDVGSNLLTEEIAASVLDAADPGVAAGMQVAAGGPVGNELSSPATESSEVIGLLSAMIILAFAFGTIVAMGMPIATAVIGLVVGLSCIGLLGHVVTVPTIAPTLATMIGLGVGIDYALFLVSRHRGHLREGMAMDESIALTVATSGSAVVYAGGTVVIALLALAVAQIPLVTSLGYASAVAVGTAVIAAITLLPALLALVGPRIESLKLPAFLRSKPKEPGRGFWAAWARFVASHPVWTILGAIALLVPLLIPALSLQLGQEDIGAVPKSTTQRQAYDLMAAGFGVGYNGPLLIAVELGAPATPSSEYESQLSQAQALQKQLQQEQTEGTTQQADLTQESNELKKEQTALEKQQAQLEQQQAALTKQSEELTVQQNALQDQAATLQKDSKRLASEQAALSQQQLALAKQALRLAAEIGAVTGSLAAEKARIRAAEAALARAKQPKVRAALMARLQLLESREQRREQRLASLRTQEKALRADEQVLRADQADLRTQEQELGTQAIALARSASTLASQSAALLQQKEDLQQEANSLQVQAANLQTQAADLKTQQAQLEGLQQQATTQQQQAEQLQAELTQELTQAGGDDRGTDARLVTLQNGLTSTEDVLLVSPPQINEGGTAATFSVIAVSAPSAPETADLVRTLRAYTIPQAEQGTDIEAHVGGSTAANVDLAAAITSRLLLVIATVIALSFIVLMAAYRSLIVPAQAALTNVLSVTAAFGILTAVFQWGWGLSLVGIDIPSGTDPIASYVPLMMFAVLFGLSMDYQVFLLSQIEHFRHARRTRRPTGGRRRPRVERARDRLGRADHDRGLRQLHPQRRPDREAVRRRARSRRCPRVDDGADARASDPRRRRPGRLVVARPAQPDPAAPRHRRYNPRVGYARGTRTAAGLVIRLSGRRAAYELQEPGPRKRRPWIPVVAPSECGTDVGVAGYSPTPRNEACSSNAPDRYRVPLADVCRQPCRALEHRAAVVVGPRASSLTREARELDADRAGVPATCVPRDVLLPHALDDRLRIDAVVRRHLRDRAREPRRARLRSSIALPDLHRVDHDEGDDAMVGDRPVRALDEVVRHTPSRVSAPQPTRA